MQLTKLSWRRPRDDMASDLIELLLCCWRYCILHYSLMWASHTCWSHLITCSIAKWENTQKNLIRSLWREWETHVHGNYLNQTSTWQCHKIIFPSLKTLASIASLCKIMLWLQFEGKIHNTLAQLQHSATLPVSDWNLPLWTQKSKQKMKLKTSKKLPSAGCWWSWFHSTHKSPFWTDSSAGVIPVC